jgi:hypothetical protein
MDMSLRFISIAAMVMDPSTFKVGTCTCRRSDVLPENHTKGNVSHPLLEGPLRLSRYTEEQIILAIPVNLNRIYRLCKEEGLSARKRIRKWLKGCPRKDLRPPHRPCEPWAVELTSDALADSRTLWTLNVVGTFMGSLGGRRNAIAWIEQPLLLAGCVSDS